MSKQTPIREMRTLEELAPHITQLSNTVAVNAGLMKAAIDGDVPGFGLENDLVLKEILKAFDSAGGLAWDITDAIDAILAERQQKDAA